MENWIREHPYLGGSLVLLVVALYFLLRSKGGSSSGGIVVSGPSDATIQAQVAGAVQQSAISAQENENTQTLQAALQGQILQNQQATQTAKINTTAAQALAKIQNQGLNDQISGAETIAGIGAGVQNLQTTTAADTATKIATIQSQTNDQQLADELTAALSDNATSLTLNSDQMKTALAQINANTNIQEQAIKATSQANVIDQANQLAALQDTNNTALQINNQNVARDSNIAQLNADTTSTVAQLNAGVQQSAITANTTVSEQSLADELAAIIAEIQGQVTAQQNQEQFQQGQTSSVNSNLGGLSQTNRAAIFETELGAPSVATATTTSSNSAASAQSQSLASIIGSIVGGIKSVVPAVFG